MKVVIVNESFDDCTLHASAAVCDDRERDNIDVIVSSEGGFQTAKGKTTEGSNLSLFVRLLNM